MVRVTRRDEDMLAWLSEVRLASMDAIRWALACNTEPGDDVQPVTIRRAQQWSFRLFEIGLLGRARPTFEGGNIVWATPDAGGRGRPNLYRQTTRHEIAVAAISARYLARGYAWSRDRKPLGVAEHQADGVASLDGVVELIEVELTPKTPGRYRLIHNNHAQRLTSEGVARVTYFCTPDAHRTVVREADRHLFRDLRPRLASFVSMDARGRFVGDEDAPFAGPLMSVVGERPVELWDRSVG